MAARKKARKKKARKKTARKKAPSLMKAVERELGGLSKRFDRQMDRLGSGLDKTQRDAGREAARLLRQARTRLDKTLVKLERSVRPKPARKKKATRKKA